MPEISSFLFQAYLYCTDFKVGKQVKNDRLTISYEY